MTLFDLKELIIISNFYPFYIGEDWMYKELKESAKYFDKIILYPLEKKGDKARWVPENCEVRDVLTLKKFKGNKLDWKLHFNILFTELFNSGKAWYIIKNLRSFLRVSFHCQVRAEIIQQELPVKKENSYFYSVWMGDGATILSILKKRNVIDNFVFRLHGYDLYDERREGLYMPFRYFNFKHADRVFVLSEFGKEYILKKKLFNSKIITNYSGLYDNGFGPFDDNEPFVIVSCSTMFKFKRVNMIAKVLNELTFRCEWHHFGDGEEFKEINQFVKGMRDNISVTLHGRVDNNVVIDFYKKNKVNLFIHLSETEGLGMAAVEAQSFGIPAISIDTGGVKEVVNEKTGILLERDSTVLDVAESIICFKDSWKNNFAFRVGVRQQFLQKFEADKNYAFFFNKIIEIKTVGN